MTRDKKPDAFDWFGALEASTQQAREVAFTKALHAVVECRCGAAEARGRDLGVVVDLRNVPDDVSVVRNEGARSCRGCPHYIPHGAMCVRRHYGPTTTVRDHYHPECVVI